VDPPIRAVSSIGNALIAREKPSNAADRSANAADRSAGNALFKSGFLPQTHAKPSNKSQEQRERS
jgi:hypothetical protein